MPTALDLNQFLISALTLLIVARAGGYVFERLRMPRLVGEICGGILVGPSALGLLMPQATGWLVPIDPLNDRLISALYWSGLILLMFTAGFRIQRNFSAPDRRLAGRLLFGATAVPFAAGLAAAYYLDLSEYFGPRRDPHAFALVLAIAVTVTTIPVISRIFIDLQIIKTRFAKIVLAASTVQDVLLWGALAVATSLAATTSPSIASAGMVVARTVIFFAAVLILGPPLLRYTDQFLKASRSTYALLWCCLIVLLAEALDVNVIFGSFLAGITLGAMPEREFGQAKDRISSFGLRYLIPVYFAIVGFRIDLPNAFDAVSFVGFFFFSSIVVGASVFVAMRLSRCTSLTSWHFAVAMNARGGPGIVLASIAFDAGLIDQRFFVTLILVAIATSLGAGAWFRHTVAACLPLLDEKPGTLERHAKPNSGGRPTTTNKPQTL